MCISDEYGYIIRIGELTQYDLESEIAEGNFYGLYEVGNVDKRLDKKCLDDYEQMVLPLEKAINQYVRVDLIRELPLLH